ncbi:MAG: peptidyl-prolyl cis-trans isomerase [Solirubrobacteraceae bacterium]
MKSVRSIRALSALFVAVALTLALAVAGCGSSAGDAGGVPSGDVAVVAGNPISLRALDHWMYVGAKAQAASNPSAPVIIPDPPNYDRCVAQARKEIPQVAKTPTKTLKSQCAQLFTSLNSEVMDFLIKAYWYQADAHKLGISVTDSEVDKALLAARGSQYKTAAQYQTLLKSTGQTNADLMFQFRIRAIYKKLAARHLKPVTAASIAAYYNSHKSQFGTPEMRSMRVVLTKTQAAAATAKAALARGQSWATVAKRYSTDPTTKASGGLLTNQTASQLDQGLSTAAFAAPVNKLLGPVRTSLGYYVVEVTKITPATQRTLAQSSAQIKTTLTTANAHAAGTAVDAKAKKDWYAKTSCRKLNAMADCHGYKAPKSATTPAP